MNTFNGRGLELLKTFESCRLQAYPDKGGVWTIGWGETHGVTEGMKITQDEADRHLLTELQYFCAEVQKLVKVPLNDNQFSALVDFAYNEGTGRLQNSTLLSLLNQGLYLSAADEFERWDKIIDSTGKKIEVDGLLRRRRAEKALFLTS